MRPLAKFFALLLPIELVTWNNYTTRETLFVFHSSSGRSPGTIRPFKKNQKKIYQKKKEKKKKRKRGRVFTIILLYRTYYTKSKKKFLMHLHRKHCKEGAIVVTQFWPMGFKFNFYRV